MHIYLAYTCAVIEHIGKRSVTNQFTETSITTDTSNNMPIFQQLTLCIAVDNYDGMSVPVIFNDLVVGMRSIGVFVTLLKKRELKYKKQIVVVGSFITTFNWTSNHSAFAIILKLDCAIVHVMMGHCKLNL